MSSSRRFGQVDEEIRKKDRLRNHFVKTSIAIICLSLCSVASAAEPLPETSEVFPPGLNDVARYRIPDIVVTKEGTVLAYCEACRNNRSDWGEIEIHRRRSIDGGRSPSPMGLSLPTFEFHHRVERA